MSAGGSCRRSGLPARAAAVAAVLALAALLPAAHAAPAAVASAAQPNLAAVARSVLPGGSLTVSNVALPGLARSGTLELQRSAVFAPGARIVVQAGGRGGVGRQGQREQDASCVPPVGLP